MIKKIGVLLSGCGVMDGSEIHEATLTLYFLDKHGAEYVCMAPDKDQCDVVDHVTKKPAGEKRNVLREAARIARGDIRDVKTVSADEIDGIIIPGGFGAAKNLCTFATHGADCAVDEDVARLLRELHAKGKPIGALCIAPTLVARLFGPGHGVRVTIGNDAATSSLIQKMGASHAPAAFDTAVIDTRNKIVTTPCYMVARSIKEVGAGAERVVEEILAMTAAGGAESGGA